MNPGHRATIALEHHRDAVPYTWVEALGWEQKPATGQENHAASDRADWWYHYKHPDLLAANPLGMVPTLVDGGRGAKGVVTESAVCIEFIDEMASANGGSAPPLLPSCPFERAHARLAADGVNKQVCSAYYQVLVRTEDAERRAGFAKLVDGLRNFTAGMQGDYYCGDTLSLVDCMLLPYAYRLYVLEHYRGADFAVPRSGEDGLWGKYHAWLDRATSLEYVRPTLPDQARYLKHVEK